MSNIERMKLQVQNLINKNANNGVIYKLFDKTLTIKDDLYDESISKRYYLDRTFNAIVSLDPTQEQLTEIGAEKLQVDIVVTLAYKEAVDKEILTPLSGANVEDDLLVYNNVSYRINKICYGVYINNEPMIFNLLGEKVHG